MSNLHELKVMDLPGGRDFGLRVVVREPGKPDWTIELPIRKGAPTGHVVQMLQQMAQMLARHENPPLTDAEREAEMLRKMQPGYRP